MKQLARLYALIILMLGWSSYVVSCPVCEQRQPKITRGITHGAGPQSGWDWVIIAMIAIITLLTLILSLKYLIRPGEHHRDHIKHTILNNS